MASTSFSSLNHFVFSWIIDTGATDFVTWSLSLFSTYKTVDHLFVKLPNNKKVVVSHVGTIKLSYLLILENVFCVILFPTI